jgi:hypothetical protein
MAKTKKAKPIDGNIIPAMDGRLANWFAGGLEVT